MSALTALRFFRDLERGFVGMVIHFRQFVLILALLGGAALALSGCGQKGPLYLTDEFKQGPQALELDEQELRDLQDEEALETEPYDGSLIPRR
jgi:predicted small lipoprotein YifL